MLQRSERPRDDTIYALVCPRAGHTDREVVERLNQNGALEAEILSEGFVSAKAAQSVFRTVESIAVVHPKAVKQLRS